MTTEKPTDDRSRWSAFDDGDRVMPYRHAAGDPTAVFDVSLDIELEPDWQPKADARVKVKVMIVDDEELTIDVLKVFLEEAGYDRFVTTTDSTQAMSLLFSERPDVLLLDLSMPQVDGFEILARMHADTILQHIPVVVLTASSDTTNKLKALELGATDFLTKPVNAGELLVRLRNTLAAKAHRDNLVNSDSLTGLPNRGRYLDRLEWALSHAKRYGIVGAVLQIGLDRFKLVNDALGPDIADRLLVDVAKRLRECLRESDYVARSSDDGSEPSVARLGGDEFSVLLPAMAGADHAAIVAQRILDSVAVPFTIDGQELFATCCIGIAVFPEDGTERDTIVRCAGLAMRHAKQQRRDSFHFYSRGLNETAASRLALERGLRKAFEHNELRVLYQPKFELQTGRICGAEALVRWQHPDHGLLAAGAFVPMAEETGLVVPLGEWVLRAVCRQLARWLAAGLQPGRVSVNLSSLQFREPNLAQTVQSALDDAGVSPQQLRLEMTESALMDPDGKSARTLQQFSDKGIELSIDDFGTGYSSLSYLRRFPINELKIDRSFVGEIEQDGGNRALIIAIIAMGQSLGMRIVAEGIETAEQLEFLRARGCDEGQGYLVSRPVTADAFAQLLSAPVAAWPPVAKAHGR